MLLAKNSKSNMLSKLATVAAAAEFAGDAHNEPKRLKARNGIARQPARGLYGYALVCMLMCLCMCALPNVVRGIMDENENANGRIAKRQVPQVENVGAAMDYGNPHFKSRRSTIVQLFEWKFADIAEECTSFLGPRGYAGVQLSPVTENMIVRTQQVQRPWWERYHPISYKLNTRSGNRDEFAEMSRACNAAGVRIYVDVVLNHMAGAYDNATADGETALLGTDGSYANATAYSYPGVPYTLKHFHKPCQIVNFEDVNELRNCQLDARPDVDHSQSAVRRNIVTLLNELIELGVAGFRIDSAKYIWPIDIKLIFNDVNNLSSDFDFPEDARPFVYQDICDVGDDQTSKTEYTTYGLITEYLYAAELSVIFNGRAPLSALINWGPAMGFVSHQDALVFVDSHDGQRGSLRELQRMPLLTHKQHHKYIMANAFMLAHPYGHVKRIMSSYRFDKQNTDQGPPLAASGGDDGGTDADVDVERIRSPEFDELGQCTRASGWVCEHRWPAIVHMLALANCLRDEQEDSVINFQTDGPNHIAFCRGHKAFIAINNDPLWPYEREVHTCLEPGEYCDVISGGLSDDGMTCYGKRVVVNAEGNANIMLDAVGESAEELDAFKFSSIDGKENDVLAISVGNGVEELGVLAIYTGSKVLSNVEEYVEEVGEEGGEGGGGEAGEAVGEEGEEEGGEEGGDDAPFAVKESETENDTETDVEEIVDAAVEEFAAEIEQDVGEPRSAADDEEATEAAEEEETAVESEAANDNDAAAA